MPKSKSITPIGPISGLATSVFRALVFSRRSDSFREADEAAMVIRPNIAFFSMFFGKLTRCIR